jgi:hypothetical protein
MIASSEFSYVRARLQARHGERTSEADWQALEGSRSLSLYLERARRTSLRRWAEHLDAAMTSHEIEAILRRETDRAVREVAGWMPRRWRAAIVWLAALPLLPVLEGVLDGDTPPTWASADPLISTLADVDPAGRRAILAQSALAPLVAPDAAERSIGDLWRAHWTTLWPGGEDGNPDLTAFADAVVRDLRDSAEAQPGASFDALRRGVERICIRYFRTRAASPVATFAHLGLLLVDLERFRGGTVRRSLFAGATGAEEAA